MTESLAADIRGTNTFATTLLRLSADSTERRDLFSESCLQNLANRTSYPWVFPLSQVFEPSVLDEVAMLAGIDAADARYLRHRPTDLTKEFHYAVRAAQDLSIEDALSLAGALISISRFELAEEVLDATCGRLTGRARFERAILDFIIANRTDESAERIRGAFEAMRDASASADIPRDRLLDGCVQAVVWYLKRKAIPKSLFEWFARTGNQLVLHEREELGAGTMSAWFRGVAMVPAATGNVPFTRHLMQVASGLAEDAIEQRNDPYELHLRKTYYESSVKEYLYVNRDLDKALECADQLIDVDPVWSVSYGEKAEVYQSFGLLAEAAALFDVASATGPPYVRHHRLKAANLLERLGDLAGALARHATICRIGTPSAESVAAGLVVAERISSSARRDFVAEFGDPNHAPSPA